MRMGQDQDVDALDPLAPEDRGNDPFPDVERAPGEAAAVDEHGPAAGEFDQDGLALPDVDHGDPKRGGGPPERRKNEEDEAKGESRENGRTLEAEPRPDEEEAQGDVVAPEERRRRRRDPDGQEGERVERMGDEREDGDEQPQQRGRRPRRAGEGRGERQERVADAHDQSDEGDGREIQDERGEGDAVEAPGHDRRGAERRGDGQAGELGRLERQARQLREQRRREEDDGQRRGVCQLEPDVEEARGIGEEEDEGAGRDRVQDVDVLPEKPPAEEGQGHERGPEDGRAALDKDRIKDEEDAQGQARRPPRHADEAEEREEQQVDDGDVPARDGEEVIEAGLLEVLDGRLVEPAVFAEEQGLEHGPGRRDIFPVRRGEPLFERGLDAPADARHPGPDRAGRRGGYASHK